jgi:hypothetical protein
VNARDRWKAFVAASRKKPAAKAPAVRRDCGGVRILSFVVGDLVEAKDPTKVRCVVLDVRRGKEDEHDAILIDRSFGPSWQDGLWFRIVEPKQ